MQIERVKGMYSIGLDIGIASVGWSIIDSENGRIIDLGVRLFSARNSDNNAERRSSRSTRRLYSRRKTRLKDAKKILEAHGFKLDKALLNACPYEMRVRGLSEKLTKGEIYRVITHIVKKRGISYLDEEAEISGTDAKTYKDQVNENRLLQKELTPGEIQYQRLKENGRVKTGLSFEKGYQLNVFTVKAYANELNRILYKQQEYYPEIDDEFINQFTKQGHREEAGLIYRKRPYYDGPGNAQNNSEYGRWANYKEEGQPKPNIFEQLIGKDSVNPDEVRASASSLSAQKYNLLNDLNNLTLIPEDRKLSTEEKLSLMNDLMTQEIASFGPSTLAKRLGLKVDQIKGWRVNNQSKPEIHSMKVYRDWRKIFKESDIELNDLPVEEIDTIAKVITLNSELPAAMATLDLEIPLLDESVKHVIANYFHELKKKSSKSSWHSFSTKTLNLLIPELLHTSDEQNTILERMNLKFDLRNKYADKKQLPLDDILAEIYNPTVTKSIRQTIKIFNELVKKYGKQNISHVTIEMPRDKNEADQQKNIKDIQSLNTKRKANSEKYFLEKSAWDKARFQAALRKPSFASKLLHYYLQDGKCAYSGKAIRPEDLLDNSCEIDHIIPLSISLDDSIHNKVLVTASANQEKGQRTPYMAFEQGANFNRTWDDYVVWAKSRKFNRKKEANLLTEKNIFDPDIQQGFVQRNLNDTRYASRVVLNAVQSFFYGQKELTKVRVVNGLFTHTLRKKWGSALDKTRGTHHHHAVDATLCAVSPFINIINYQYHQDADGSKYMIDMTTGEKISYRDFKMMNYYDKRSFVPIWEDFIEQLIPTYLYSRIKFSHQVDKKWNRKVSDATIYSTRKITEFKIQKNGKTSFKTEDYVIDKIKDIYTDDGWKVYDKNRDKLLMKELDEQTYKILLQIASEYPDYKEVQQANGKVKKVPVSPFQLYCEDQGVPAIRKYSKKGNGPYIRSVKYRNKKLGNHINVTKDENGNRMDKTSNNRIAFLTGQNPWRADVYFNPKKNSYEWMRIKYNDFRLKNGQYGIPLSTYNKIKERERISNDSQFLFSLYKGDCIRIYNDMEQLECLFSSKARENGNQIELKPKDKSTWKNEIIPVFGLIKDRAQVTLKEGMKIEKLTTSYLGDVFKVNQEKGPKNILIDD